ncbi:endothelin-converting enzyme 1 [Lingula anatina]|uniref:Endothelin-converting enzyme 1 n=1 Tax=Lingula anatina TaxID=7574 RepID=A0A1S3J7D8_LINAN|nr:endothelin-converting enzyme 1 [Lingula anatina]|eukprot:XP_013406315.1 endothelin-converting enzyme 1 [Lingula anatina]
MSASPYKHTDQFQMDFNSRSTLADRKNENKRWSSREKCFAFLFFFCALAIAALVLLLILGAVGVLELAPSRSTTVSSKAQTTVPPKAAPMYCMTRDCIKSADAVLSNINVSVDPCEDFHHFACDGWLQKNPMPASQGSWTNFHIFDKTIKTRNFEILKRPPERYLVESFERKVKWLFQSCMDTNSIDQLGAKPLLDAIEKIGGWAAIGTWDNNTWRFEESMSTIFSDYFVQSFLTIYMKPDDMSPEVNTVMIDQGGLGLPSAQYYFDNETESQYIMGYMSYLEKLALLLGATQENARTFAQEVFYFEKELAFIYFSPATPQMLDPNVRYNNVTVEELYHLLPQINWTRHLAQIDVDVSNNSVVIVFSKEFLTYLSTLIQQTDRRVLNQYVVKLLIASYAEHMSSEFLKARQEVIKIVSGTSPQERWEDCVALVGSTMGDAISALYVREHFSKESKEEVKSMVMEILEVYKERIDELTFMDEPTRSNALAKLRAMRYHKIGFPDYMLNDSFMDYLYLHHGVNCSNCYFQNVVDVYRGGYLYQQEEFKLPVDKDKWLRNPINVNAYYATTSNEMVILAGILQPPFYAPYFTRAMKFGSIGMIIAHEITHGFDTRGSQYDKDGRLLNWWTSLSKQAYDRATACVSSYFSNYEVSGFKVNGNLTLTENIADIGGLRVGYMAYKKWVSRNGPEKMLPGVNRTPEELFFIANSAIWCEHTRPQAVRQSIATAVHSPGSVRAMGPASQVQEFASVFRCAAGSPMNAAARCNVF